MGKQTISSSFGQNIIIVAGVVGTVLIALYLWNPTSKGWFLQCPLFQLTGWLCPLCGSQRAVHELLHGNICGAWHYNPGLWLSLPYFMLWGFGSMMENLEKYKIIALARKDGVFVSVIVLLLIWGVVRNLV